MSVEYLRDIGDSPRILSSIPEALQRSTVFESPVGELLTYLALPFLLFALYAVARVTAIAPTASVKSLAVAAAALAFGHALCWAVLLHPFHGADEAEHFSYAQYLAATNHQPDREASSARPAYSSSEQRLLEAVHQNSTVLNPSSRLRWDKTWERRYETSAAGAKGDDGGGGTESATGHSPLYYYVIGFPYRLLHRHVSLPGVLLSMRILNAALAALVAALAVIAASAFFRGGNRMQCWVAGVLVAFQPVYGTVAASINNDTAVNFAAALLITVLIRCWADGPSAGRGVAAGFALALLPLAKITGFGVYPTAAVASLTYFVRYRFAMTAKWLAMTLGVMAGVALLWIFAVSPLMSGERGTLRNVHAVPPAAAAAAPTTVGPGPVTLVDKANYFAQTLLPSALFKHHLWQLPGSGPIQRSPLYFIYVKRGYGLLGWKSVDLSWNLLKGITASLMLGWSLALVAAFRCRRDWREWLGGAAILTSAILAVLAFVSYAYATNDVHTDAGEQGRYLFTAIVPLAVLLSSASLGVKDRWVGFVASAMACGAVGLAIMTWLSALRGWFI